MKLLCALGRRGSLSPGHRCASGQTRSNVSSEMLLLDEELPGRDWPAIWNSVVEFRGPGNPRQGSATGGTVKANRDAHSSARRPAQSGEEIGRRCLPNGARTLGLTAALAGAVAAPGWAKSRAGNSRASLTQPSGGSGQSAVVVGANSECCSIRLGWCGNFRGGAARTSPMRRVPDAASHPVPLSLPLAWLCPCYVLHRLTEPRVQMHRLHSEASVALACLLLESCR